MKWILKKLFNLFFEVVEEETEVLDELDEVVNDVIEYVREEVFETATDKFIKVADWTKNNVTRKDAGVFLSVVGFALTIFGVYLVRT